jgi:hypothetical protein
MLANLHEMITYIRTRKLYELCWTLPDIEDFSYVFELGVVCLGVGVDVLIHIVI